MHRATRILHHLSGGSSSAPSQALCSTGKPNNAEPAQKVVLITGGNRGIGKALVAAFATRLDVATVLFTARDEKQAAAVASELRSAGCTNVHALVVDVSSDESVNNCIRQVFDQYKRVDVLINNAGVAFPDEHLTPVYATDSSKLLASLQTNAVGASRLCSAIVPRMIQNNFGRVVNVSSAAGSLTYMAGTSLPYRMSKAAMNALTRALSFDTQKYNILVNSACPGPVATDINVEIRKQPSAQRTHWKQPEDALGTIMWLATLPSSSDSPRGQFYQDFKRLPW